MNKKLLFLFLLVMLNLFQHPLTQAQNCDASVPVYLIDFSSLTADSTWTSPLITRNGNCCNTLPPDRCVLFSVNAGSNVVALVFQICGGPIPPGSISYQVTCGPNVTYNDTTFISSAGIYHLTFCKPGTNVNNYCITGLVSLPMAVSSMVGEFHNSKLFCDFETGEYFIEVNLVVPASIAFHVFSSDGKMISEKNYSLGSGRQQISIPTENLDAGIYFVRVRGEQGQTANSRFIISR